MFDRLGAGSDEFPKLLRVISFATRNLPYSEREEVQQDMWVEVMKARDRYDESRGASFATFAAASICWERSNSLRRRDVVTMGQRKRIQSGEDEAVYDVALECAESVGAPGIDPETAAVQSDLVERCLAVLNPRQRHIVVETLMKERPCHELAGELGLSQARVHQIQLAAVAKMQKRMGARPTRVRPAVRWDMEFVLPRAA